MNIDYGKEYNITVRESKDEINTLYAMDKIETKCYLQTMHDLSAEDAVTIVECAQKALESDDCDIFIIDVKSAPVTFKIAFSKTRESVKALSKDDSLWVGEVF